MRVSFHCKALSMRRIYGVGEISKIIPTSIVVSTVVPLANTVSAAERRCASTTTGRGSSRATPASVLQIDDFYLTRGGLWLVTDLSTKDLWRIGNTRRSQFTAHYLARPSASSPRISLRQRYPPSSPSCVLSHLLFLFSDISYISTVARFSLYFFVFSLRCFFKL